MCLTTSYLPNYYCIDDILATQERIPCKFIHTVPKMGKLNPATDDNDLKLGTVLELPLWLVLEISKDRDPTVLPDLPKVYKEAYREILKADASAIDLHKLNMYFYEIGSYIKHFDKKGEVHEILLHTFKTRLKKVMELAENCVSDPSVQETLDNLERKLFCDGHNARVKLNTWLLSSGAPLEAAGMVQNHKKRKRVDIDLN